MPRACRRDAPPGFRAAPRADFAVTAIWLQSTHAFAPAALRASLASRGKPCGLSPPRAAWRPSMPPNRLSRIGQASAPPQWAGMGRLRRDLLRQVVRMRAVLNVGGSRPSVTKDGSRTFHRHHYGASTPRLKASAARCGRGVLDCRRVVELARVSGRASAGFMRGCRAGPVAFRCGSAQGVFVLL